MKQLFEDHIQEHLDVMRDLNTMSSDVEKASALIVAALKRGNKLLLCGNGGSAADSQHIAAEIIGRFETERHALPAIALTTDTSILTAVGNDYGYDAVFSRQVAGLAQSGDVLLAYSTSGNSKNIVLAIEQAKALGCDVIALTGKGGGQMQSLASVNLCVPSDSTARIQEAHAFLGHFLCMQIDAAFEV